MRSPCHNIQSLACRTKLIPGCVTVAQSGQHCTHCVKLLQGQCHYWVDKNLIYFDLMTCFILIFQIQAFLFLSLQEWPSLKIFRHFCFWPYDYGPAWECALHTQKLHACSIKMMYHIKNVHSLSN